AEAPGWNVFALEDGVVYHTYSRTAPDRFMLSPYYDQLLDQVPAGRDPDFPLRRHDEYEAAHDRGSRDGDDRRRRSRVGPGRSADERNGHGTAIGARLVWVLHRRLGADD